MIRKRYKIDLVYFCLFGVFSLIFSLYKPYHNWDMIMYMAAAKSFEEHDLEKLHKFTYAQLQNSVSEEKYQELTGGYYGSGVRNDTSAFIEQLPFYQIRPLYTGAVYILYKAGLDLALATHMISGVSVAMAIAILYVMVSSFLPREYIFSIPIAALFFGAMDIARLSSPDAMAFLGVILSAYLYLNGRHHALMGLLVALIAIRTDLILYVIPLLVSMFLSINQLRWKIALALVVSLTMYFLINAYWKNPGWGTIFHFTFIELSTHPLSNTIKLTLHDYVHVLLPETISLIKNKAFLVWLVIAGYSGYLGLLLFHNKNIACDIGQFRVVSLSVVCAIFIIFHIALFPASWDRFFAGQYIVSFIMLLMMINNRCQKYHD